MSDSTDWVMRPVMRNICSYEALVDGRLRLIDIARMNEALDVEDENIRRYRNASPTNP